MSDCSLYTYPSCEPVFKTLWCSCGEQHPYQQGCNKRLCPVCQPKIAFKSCKKYMPLLQLLYKQAQQCRRSLKFITLTLKNRDLLDFREIRHYLTLLRRQCPQYFHSGLYVLETKQDGHGWHTHIHVVCDSDYVIWSELRDRWHTITGDSYITKPERVRSVYGAKCYITGYLSKKHSFYSEQDAETFMSASKGQKLIQTFGSKYGFFVNKSPFVCPVCGSRWFSEWDIIGLEPDFYVHHSSASINHSLEEWG